MSFNHQLQLQHQPPLIIDTLTTAEEEEPPIPPPPVVSEDKTKTTTTTTHHHHHHHRKSTTTTLPLVPCTPYYNNPDLVVPLTVDCHSGSIEERDRQLIEAARAVCPPEFWSGSNEEDIEVSVLTGGLSNALFVVTTNAQKRQQRSTSSSGGCVKCGEEEDGGDDETESTSSWSTSGGEEEEQRSTNTVVVPQSVLIRVHFDEQDSSSTSSDDDGGALFVNRNTEIRNLCHLSNQSNNLAPALYGRFLNGRVEQFYPNAQTLNPTLMKSDKYWCTIATMMGQIHNERPPTQQQLLRTTNGEEDEEGGDCWNKVDTWFELATRTANSKGDGEWERMKLHDKRWEELDVFGRMKEEWIWLKSQLLLLSSENGSEGDDDDDDDGDDVVGEEEREIRNMAIQFAREVVFTHMDMQSLNLLRVINEEEEEEDTTATTTTTTTSEEEQLKVIDFEYSGYNPRSADIANTFCECCEMNDLRADFMNQYPTIEEQNSYLRSYITSVDSTTGAITQRLNNNPRRWDIFLDELRKEVGKHSCLSHMTWSVWSVSQAMLSPIEYDYLEYGLLRWEGYNTFKRWFFFSTPSSSEEESSEVAEVEKEQQQQQEEETVTTQQKQEAVAHDEDVSVMGGEKHEEHQQQLDEEEEGVVFFNKIASLP